MHAPAGESNAGMRTYQPGPNGVDLPDDLLILPPGPQIPGPARAFFGANGKWWGSWRSRQVKDGFDSILVVTQFRSAIEVDACLIVPDHPRWYVERGAWKGTGRLAGKEEGKMTLSFSPTPFGEPMYCSFTARGLEGTVFTRFLKLEILWQPLK